MADTKTSPTEKVARIATEASAAGAAQATKIVQDSTVQAQKMFTDSAAQARVAMEQGVAQATKSSEEMMKATQDAMAFGRSNFEAVTLATQTYMAGVQDLSKQAMALVQGMADHAMEGAKALGAVKSLKEAADVQAAFAKAGYEKAMSESTKLQEATLKLVESAAAPITARMTVAMEKVSKPLAA